jgi:hypothetical protein
MSRPCIAAARFDFRKRVSYDPEAKRLFHTHARRQLPQARRFARLRALRL